MKPFCAMWLSVLLLVAQFLVAEPGRAGVPGKVYSASCCPPAEAVHCSAKCCLAPTEAPGKPLTPAPLPAPSARIGLDLSVPQSPLWLLPSPDPRALAFSAWLELGSSSPGDVPLFLQHAALLI